MRVTRVVCKRKYHHKNDGQYFVPKQPSPLKLCPLARGYDWPTVRSTGSSQRPQACLQAGSCRHVYKVPTGKSTGRVTRYVRQAKQPVSWQEAIPQRVVQVGTSLSDVTNADQHSLCEMLVVRVGTPVLDDTGQKVYLDRTSNLLITSTSRTRNANTDNTLNTGKLVFTGVFQLSSKWILTLSLYI